MDVIGKYIKVSDWNSRIRQIVLTDSAVVKVRINKNVNWIESKIENMSDILTCQTP